MNAVEITNRLEELRKADRRLSLFGSEAHEYRLNPPLPEKKVQAFEKRYRIRLPAEYRQFLTEIGNGGAGPHYGLFPLGMMDSDGYEPEPIPSGFLGSLSQPFPHRQAWNLNKGELQPPRGLDENAMDEFMAALDDRYFAPRLMNGAIPISHEGDAIRLWLVVKGKECGNIWRDARPEQKGIAPVTSRKSARITFVSWYMTWLDSARRQVMKQR